MFSTVFFSLIRIRNSYSNYAQVESRLYCSYLRRQLIKFSILYALLLCILAISPEQLLIANHLESVVSLIRPLGETELKKKIAAPY